MRTIHIGDRVKLSGRGRLSFDNLRGFPATAVRLHPTREDYIIIKRQGVKRAETWGRWLLIPDVHP